MKLFWLLLLLFCSSCAAITADPWGWLDDPAEQKWIDVLVRGHEWEIQYSVPDRLPDGGQRTRFWPELNPGESSQLIAIDKRLVDEKFLAFGEYFWDWWWGGYFKKGDFDFTLSTRLRFANDFDLLTESLDDRIDRTFDEWRSSYQRNGEASDFGRLVIDRLWVKAFRSRQGLTWVVQNNPAVTEDHIYYTIPITNQHILEFSFFVRDKRFGWKDDPEWNARRWALVEQIMNTVRITPDPFSTAPATSITN